MSASQYLMVALVGIVIAAIGAVGLIVQPAKAATGPTMEGARLRGVLNVDTGWMVTFKDAKIVNVLRDRDDESLLIVRIRP